MVRLSVCVLIHFAFCFYTVVVVVPRIYMIHVRGIGFHLVVYLLSSDIYILIIIIIINKGMKNMKNKRLIRSRSKTCPFFLGLVGSIFCGKKWSSFLLPLVTVEAVSVMMLPIPGALKSCRGLPFFTLC